MESIGVKHLAWNDYNIIQILSALPELETKAYLKMKG